MKKFRKNILGIIALNIALLSTTTLAGPSWRGPGKLTGVFLNYHNMGVSMVFDNSVSANACPVSNEVILNRTLEGYRDIYATLLAAYVAKKQVDVWLSGICQNNRNIGTAFSVSD